MTITSRDEGPAPETASELPPAPVPNDVKPFCKFVNVKLCGLSPDEGVSGTQATVLLENPQGKNMLDAKGLLQQVIVLNKMIFNRTYICHIEDLFSN